MRVKVENHWKIDLGNKWSIWQWEEDEIYYLCRDKYDYPHEDVITVMTFRSFSGETPRFRPELPYNVDVPDNVMNAFKMYALKHRLRT